MCQHLVIFLGFAKFSTKTTRIVSKQQQQQTVLVIEPGKTRVIFILFL